MDVQNFFNIMFRLVEEQEKVKIDYIIKEKKNGKQQNEGKRRCNAKGCRDAWGSTTYKRQQG